MIIKNKKGYAFPIGLVIVILIILALYYGFFGTATIIQPISLNKTYFEKSFKTSIENIQLQGNRDYSCIGADFINDFTCDNGQIPAISNGISSLQSAEHPKIRTNNNPLFLWVDANDDTISYINVEGTFPKGVLEVTCDIKSYSSGNSPAYAYCSVNSVTKSVSATISSPNNADIKTGEKIIINTDNTKVKIEAKVDSSPLSYASSEVEIKFIPDVKIEEEKPSPITGAVSQAVEETQNIFQKIWIWIKGVLGI